MRKNPFREIKRIISQAVETEFWYRFRKIPDYWYDSDEEKFLRMKDIPARDFLTSTWNGEDDILEAMLLKVEHMFWNLRHYGVEQNYYVYTTDLQKYGTAADKNYVFNRTLERIFAKNGDKIWLCNAENVDKALSDSGLVHFYLKREEPDRYAFVASFDEQIPFDKIPKKNKLYSVKTTVDENGKKKIDMREEAPQYKVKAEAIVYSFATKNLGKTLTEDLEGLSTALKIKVQNYGDISDDFEGFCINPLGFVSHGTWDYSFEINEIPKLSKKLRNYAVGNFCKCRDLLHLRRLIKKLIALDDMNGKYYNMWASVQNNEERHQKLLESQELFQKDRKEAYKAISDFMCEKGQRWWD